MNLRKTFLVATLSALVLPAYAGLALPDGSPAPIPAGPCSITYIEKDDAYIIITPSGPRVAKDEDDLVTILKGECKSKPTES